VFDRLAFVPLTSNMGLFSSNRRRVGTNNPASEIAAPGTTSEKGDVLPVYNHNGHLVTKGIHPDGESGRSGVLSKSHDTNRQTVVQTSPDSLMLASSRFPPNPFCSRCLGKLK
jgi:hypothetical protein